MFIYYVIFINNNIFFISPYGFIAKDSIDIIRLLIIEYK